MTKLHRYAKNAGVVEDRLRDIDRADSLPEEAVEVVSTGEDIYGKLDDITHVAKTTVATYKSSGLYSSAATAGGAAAGSALFYFAVGELVAAGVDTITTGFKQNAKLAAANHAYNSMRLPVLHELADLKERARNGRLSPGQIVRMHLLEQQHFNVCKIGNATMHKIVMGLNQSVLGGVWDVLVDSTEAQSVLRERRDRHELAAAASHAELGEWWARSDDTFAESVNREVYGDV
jgi:PII-like signaling protein